MYEHIRRVEHGVRREILSASSPVSHACFRCSTLPFLILLNQQQHTSKHIIHVPCIIAREITEAMPRATRPGPHPAITPSSTVDNLRLLIRRAGRQKANGNDCGHFEQKMQPCCSLPSPRCWEGMTKRITLLLVRSVRLSGRLGFRVGLPGAPLVPHSGLNNFHYVHHAHNLPRIFINHRQVQVSVLAHLAAEG